MTFPQTQAGFQWNPTSFLLVQPTGGWEAHAPEVCSERAAPSFDCLQIMEPRALKPTMLGLTLHQTAAGPGIQDCHTLLHRARSGQVENSNTDQGFQDPFWEAPSLSFVSDGELQSKPKEPQ